MKEKERFSSRMRKEKLEISLANFRGKRERRSGRKIEKEKNGPEIARNK